MLSKLRTLSLRWKLSFALVALAMSVVGMYVVIAKNTFESDKIAYVFNSRQTTLASISSSASEKFDGVLLAARLLLLQVDLKTKILNAGTNAYFEGQKTLVAIELSNDKGESIVTLSKSVESKKQLEEAAVPKEVTLIRSLGHDDYLISSRERDNGSAPWLIKVIAHIPEILPPSNAEGMILLTDGNHIVASQADATEFTNAIEDFSKDRADVTSTRDIRGQRYLASVTSVRDSSLKLIAFDKETVALAAIGTLYQRSLIFIAFSICLTILLAMALSARLTETLKGLTRVANAIAQGNFEQSVTIKSEDEMGVLAQAFRRMGEEIQKLLEQTKETTRMESELKTARLVQDSLFPKEASATRGEFSISGIYRTSSECGGDWWYHFEYEEDLYVVIADATGHGTPAALVTSAARSVFSKIEMKRSTLLEIAQDWDRAVEATSGQRVFMTALMLRLNKTTGVGTYLNASHEGPILIKASGGELEAEAVVLRPGSPLGKAKRNWEEVPFNIDRGQRLVIFTDGLWDITNESGKTLSDVRFMKTLCKLASSNETAKAFVDKISEYLEGYRKGRDLPDDVTLVVISHDSSAKPAV